MKYFLLFLSILNVGNFHNLIQAEMEPKNVKDLKDFLSCDYLQIENQLESLKTGNEYLKLRFEMMQHQFNKQKELYLGLEKKLDNFEKSLKSMETKILKQNNEHFKELVDLVNSQNQIMHSREPPVDDKWPLLSDIKQTQKNHEELLENIKTKQNNTYFITKDSWENHTEKLENLTKNSAILQKIEEKLTKLEKSTPTRTELIGFHKNIEKYFNKNGESKICLRTEDKKLICNIQAYPTSCAEFDRNYCANNKCRIYNHLYGSETFLAACNDVAEGGGWTVIQRRINGSVDFYLNWSEYKDGFGNIDGEFFIGLDKLHALTSTLQPVELLIQLQDFNDTMKYAKYDAFVIGNETEKYKLSKIGSYSGTAGDSFSTHEGKQFSTKDQDNDEDSTSNCAIDKTGAWWYKSCMWSNLNGRYYANGDVPKSERGICWNDFHGYGYSMKFVQMMIRPKRV